MTSDGIDSNDWDMVHSLALKVANAQSDEAYQSARGELLQWLRELHRRYGDRPSILATEADYAETPSESEALLLRAYGLAENLADSSNLAEISLSLAGLYANELGNREQALLWLDIAKGRIAPGDRSQFDEFISLREKLARLG